MKRIAGILLPGIVLLLVLTVSLIGIPSAAEQDEEGVVSTYAATTTGNTEAPLMTEAIPDAAARGESSATSASEGESITGLFDDVFQWFEDIAEGIAGINNAINDKFLSLWDDISGGFTDITSSIGDMFNSFWDRREESINTAVLPFQGKGGLLVILSHAGGDYVTDELNDTIDALYEIFYVPGIVVMVICFCYSMAKGCFSLDFSSKNSLIQPVIGMIVTLFAFTMAREIMTVLFTMAVDLTRRVVASVGGGDIAGWLEDTIYSENVFGYIGYWVLSGVLQLILMVNIAKIALLQSIAPFFIGFAPAENTRRIMFNLLKEYGRCCLVPPITAAYALIMFCVSESTWGVISSIVIGFSLFSMASKKLDKLIT